MTMQYQDTRPDHFYWNDDATLPLAQKGKFIVLGGNTASGKSTILKEISFLAQKNKLPIITLNERILHHPLMKLQFHFPKEYSFLMQMNFAVQRRLLLYRWLSLGYHVVSERCHLDDDLYMQHHLKSGHISPAEYAVFQQWVSVANQPFPDPDVYIYLDVSPEVSFQRIRACEQKGERPQEFPDDGVKRQLIASWAARYRDFFEALVAAQQAGRAFEKTTFLKWEAEHEAAEKMADRVMGFFREKH